MFVHNLILLFISGRFSTGDIIVRFYIPLHSTFTVKSVKCDIFTLQSVECAFDLRILMQR